MVYLLRCLGAINPRTTSTVARVLVRTSTRSRDSRTFLTALRIALSLALWSGSALLSASDKRVPDLTIEYVIKALQANADRAPSLRIRWKETAQFNPGALLSPTMARAEEMEGKALDTGIPLEVVRFDCPSELLIKGEWMRYSTKTCRIENDTIVPQDWISTYDGRDSRFLIVTKQGQKEGDITKLRTSPDSSSIRFFPLLVLFRPFEPYGILARDKLAIEQTTSILNGRSCLILYDGKNRLWVEPRSWLYAARHRNVPPRRP